MRADGLLVQPYDLLMLFTEDDTTVDLRWYSPIFKSTYSIVINLKLSF